MAKINEHPYVPFINNYERPNNAAKEPNYVVPNATLPIRVLAKRFVKGELSGIQVHECQYSDELQPMLRKGIDLCDYSEIRELYENSSARYKEQYDELSRQLTDLAAKMKADQAEPKEKE